MDQAIAVRIDLRNQADVAFWVRTLEATELEIRQALRAVGEDYDAVRRFITAQRHPKDLVFNRARWVWQRA
jgi:hypothetical protein